MIKKKLSLILMTTMQRVASRNLRCHIVALNNNQRFDLTCLVKIQVYEQSHMALICIKVQHEESDAYKLKVINIFTVAQSRI